MLDARPDWCISGNVPGDCPSCISRCQWNDFTYDISVRHVAKIIEQMDRMHGLEHPPLTYCLVMIFKMTPFGHKHLISNQLRSCMIFLMYGLSQGHRGRPY